jgi:hypothetical protein
MSVYIATPAPNGPNADSVEMDPSILRWADDGGFVPDDVEGATSLTDTASIRNAEPTNPITLSPGNSMNADGTRQKLNPRSPR